MFRMLFVRRVTIRQRMGFMGFMMLVFILSIHIRVIPSIIIRVSPSIPKDFEPEG